MFLLQSVVDSVSVVPTPTTGFELAQYLISIGVGAVVGYVVKFFEKISVLVKQAPEWLKLAITGVLAFLVVKIESILGLQLPENPLSWNVETLNLVLTTSVALGLRTVVKKNTPPPQAE